MSHLFCPEYTECLKRFIHTSDSGVSWP